MITLSVNIDGIERKLETLAETAKDLEPALRMFDGYLRARVRQRFASGGPGWPERSAEDEGKRHRADQVDALAVHKMQRKLEREFDRARRRRAAGKGTEAAVERRYAVLKEFMRQAAGGAVGIQGGKDARREKSIAGLRQRFQRAAERDHGILGKLASSIASTVSRGTLTLYSKVAWAGVHNEGGTVGHGATLPARPFLFLESSDIDVLAEILTNRFARALT